MAAFGEEAEIILFAGMNTATAIGQTVTIPSGGGQAFAQVAIKSFTSNVNLPVNFIDVVLHIRLVGAVPQPVNGAGFPQFGTIAGGQAVGITLFASAGTTLTFNILAMVH